MTTDAVEPQRKIESPHFTNAPDGRLLKERISDCLVLGAE